MNARMAFRLLCASLAVVAMTSCDPKQGAIDKLENLSEKLEKNYETFSEKDWEEATAEYEAIVKKMDEMEFSDEQSKEIGRLKGKCVKYMAKGAFKNFMKDVNEGAEMIKGLIEK